MIVNDVFLVSFSDRLERVTLAWSVQVTIYDKWFVFLISGGSQNTNISVSDILCAQRLRTANTSVSATKYMLTFTIMQKKKKKQQNNGFFLTEIFDYSITFNDCPGSYVCIN